MSGRFRFHRGFMLLELLFMLTIAAIVLLLLDKMFLDGLYLNRLAVERENRTATTESLVERLRADALGATDYAWEPAGAAGTLQLTCVGATGDAARIEWIFQGDEIRRLEDGRDAGVYSATRLGFRCALQRGARADLLALELIVAPPDRPQHRDPRITEARVLLPAKSREDANREGVVSL